MNRNTAPPAYSTELADGFFNEGMRCVRTRDFETAARAFRDAVSVDPEHSEAQNNLGAALAALNRHEEAVSAYRSALEIDANYAQAYFNLGASLKVLGTRDEAFECFTRTVQINPGHEEAYYYLGLEHQADGRLNEALACYLRASDLTPNEADIYTAIGSVLLRFRMYDGAAQAFEKAHNLNSDDSVATANLLYLLARDCDWDRLGSYEAIVPGLGVAGGHVPPFPLLAMEDCPERHRIRSEKFASVSYSQITRLPAAARPATRPKRLSIGYFSADFHDHATMYLAARMFELHDRDRFSIHAYAYGPDRTGVMRDRAIRAFDQFQDVGELSDQAVAELARADGIDIAIDLKGYTEHQRLGIFSRRPAPVQMSYLGYPGTLATSFIDYLIADAAVIPDDQRPFYSERLIYLPNSYQATDNTRNLAAEAGTRAEHGLPSKGFVFCCFNNSYKIGPAEFDLWMDILKSVDGSVLWLLITPGQMESNLRTQCQMRGVDPKRLIFAPRVSHDRHVARLGFADLFLDTFNYNAHTTASDALWAGVPVLTMCGKGFPARVATSLLRSIGLDELVTSNHRIYHGLALSLARNPAKLASVRAKLAANRTTEPLFNSELFTRHIEAGYDLAYQRFLDGKEPADISVPS